MSETRKLAAILFADVVGYSRLMGEDEAGTARAVRQHREAARPIVASHGGRIVRTIGDGLLLEFPSVVAAVECAIVIQKLMVERNAETARIEAHPLSHRRQSRRRADRGRRHCRRRRQYRGAARRHLRARRHLYLRDAYEQVRGKVDAHFVDLGEKDLKNIARPVRVYAVRPGQKPQRRRLCLGVEHARAAPSLYRGPALRQLGGDPEQDYFVDGVTESLTTDLSRIGGFLVIGRSTAFTYKGKAVDLKKIGRELNVRYVLEGSVQRGGNRMRVNVQLIDAESANHLWADRFDKPLADLFDMQDEIVARLANALSAPLVAAEARRAERTPNPDSMDLCFQARALWNKGFTADNLAEARRLFERAVALDPASAFGLIGVAAVDTAVALNLFPDDRAARLATAEAAAIKALSLAPENAAAHLCLGVVEIHTNRASEGIRQCQRSLQLDRNLANAHAVIGNGKIRLGQAEETEAHVQEALRLSPRDANVHLWCLFAGVANFHLGREEEAIAWARRSIETNRAFPSSHFLLAGALSRLGRLPEARSEARTGLALFPTFTISKFRASAWSDHPTAVAARERYFDGLRKAGVPEG